MNLNIQKTFFLLIILIFAFFSPVQAQKKKRKKNKAKIEQVSELKVAFYNVENLFDLENNPQTNDDEYTPTGEMRWDTERYNKKLSSLASVIKELGGESNTPPDILGLCEVENISVLQDLSKQFALKEKNYQIVHFDSPDERGIDVALMYDPNIFTPTFKHNFKVNLPGNDSTTRDFLVVKGYITNTTNKEKITFVVNHWPSRRNPEETRLVTARKVRFTLDSLNQSTPNEPILLMGDFNDEPQNESLKILTQGNPIYIDAMTELANKGEGTHEYKKEWNMLDHFVYSSSLSGGKIYCDTSSVKIFKPEWIQESNPKFKGQPFRTYIGKKYLGGYSDHFPIYLRLKIQN